jgi:hypothetical protein
MTTTETFDPHVAQYPIHPEEISINILYPGDRVKKMSVPLQASRLDVSVDPPNPYDADVVLCDNADKMLGYEVVKKHLHSAQIIYRMRGDVYHELDLWDMHPLKQFVAERVVLPNVDGCIAVSQRLAKSFGQTTGIPSGAAGLWKRPGDWPTQEHTDSELRIITLTNCNYYQKIKPIMELAPIVNDCLRKTGGRWHVCGDGEHDEWLAEALAGYSNVHFRGYVDATEELQHSNLMLHPSYLDGQPNSILEGLASGLPVITNDFEAFTRFNGPIEVAKSQSKLHSLLRQYSDPQRRADKGDESIRYMEENHTPEAIARQYEHYLTQFLA